MRLRVPEIREPRWGDNIGQSPHAYDLAVAIDFDDRASFDRYLASAAHREYVGGPARAAVGSLVVVQHARVHH
jgi:Stress responsive A/B Barrel Domain